MTRVGETVRAEVIEVQPRRLVPSDGFHPTRCEGGFCRVACEWGTYNLVDGSVQQVRPEDRVVGRQGWLRWTQAGGYCGPVWVRE